MGSLTTLLSKFVGRYAVRSASRDILKKYGLQATKKFFAGLTDDVLARASKEELLDLAKQSITSTTKDGISRNVFSRSNARKLADIINKGTDVVEAKTRKFLEDQSLKLLNQRYVDALGRSGVDAAGRKLVARTRSQTFTRARGFASDSLEAALFPANPVQAFLGAYARGLIGESTSTAASSIIFAMPRSVLALPRGRAFIGYLRTEVNYLRSVGQVRSAAQLQKAIVRAQKQAQNLYGEQPYFLKSKTAGYISGRLTVPLASTYVFVDRDERKKNIDKFQRSIKPFAKQKVRTYVDAYTRSDGTRVKGHYRELAAA